MMKVIYKKNGVTGERMESCVLKILAYFSVFDFPLSKDEVLRFLPPGSDQDSLDVALSHLISGGSVFKTGEYYSLQNKEEWIKRKQEGYHRAEQLLPKAMKIGRFLCGFPYVRGIGISGGLSKMYAHENTDFDFFIIAKANRLWIARTILHLYKKFTFLTGGQHYHCMNYFLDEKALKLKDQNIYTAVEAFTLIPVCGEGIQDFFVANGWISEWLANYPVMMRAAQQPATRSWIKKMIERMLNNKLGNRFDNYLMKLTSRRWRKKQEKKKLNYEGKEMSLVTGKHFAWSNPDSFQQKIIGQYNKKIAEMENKWPKYFRPLSYSFEE